MPHERRDFAYDCTEISKGADCSGILGHIDLGAIGRGNGPSASNAGAPPFRTLAQRYPVEGLEEALGEGIVIGHPHMPEFRFSADDVGAVIAHLKSIQERQK